MHSFGVQSKFGRHFGTSTLLGRSRPACALAGEHQGHGGLRPRNAIAGHCFDCIEALQGHLRRWMREEAAAAALRAREAPALKPLAAEAPFLQVHGLTRCVQTDACIELDTTATVRRGGQSASASR